LRAILNKKMHPHGSCSMKFMNKYLENDPMHQSDDEDEEEEEVEVEEELNTCILDKGYKWVNTDSECKFYHFLFIYGIKLFYNIFRLHCIFDLFMFILSFKLIPYI
jgi:hypothetical protein